MSIKKIELNNFTVFEDLELDICEGINVFIGENGTGKTHLMKLIYSACKAVNPKNSFSQKIVNTFKPDDYKINRLTSRKKNKNNSTVNIAAIKNNEKKIYQLNLMNLLRNGMLMYQVNKSGNLHLEI